jgi:hypothetical protein
LASLLRRIAIPVATAVLILAVVAAALLVGLAINDGGAVSSLPTIQIGSGEQTSDSVGSTGTTGGPSVTTNLSETPASNSDVAPGQGDSAETESGESSTAESTENATSETPEGTTVVSAQLRVQAGRGSTAGTQSTQTDDGSATGSTKGTGR